MTTRSKLDAALNSEGVDRDSEIETAGISAAMERLGDAAPALLQMQSALFAGLARTQQREAERLAAIDEGSPEFAAASVRAEKLQRLNLTMAGIGSAVLNMADGQSRPGLFHGFVTMESGEPAVDHDVKVKLPGSRKMLKSTTDDTGYFRIALSDTGESGKRPTVDADRRAPADRASPTSGESSDETEVGTVTIADPSGRTVLSEPIQPPADETETLFRYYPISARSSVRRKSGKASKTAKA